jgi:UDP-N-acetylmuramoyl-L-alanyl-D-glutamate--2,6-diaminopimelate ligase
LIDGLPVRKAEGDPEVRALTADSRRVEHGALFVAMPSVRTDTHRFLSQAAQAGAAAALVRDESGFAQARAAGLAAVLLDVDSSPVDLACRPGPLGEPVPPDPRAGWTRALGAICARFYGDPTASMRLAAVTGTNGKTTVAWMLRAALTRLGLPAGYIGTLGFQTTGALRQLDNTTPFPIELWAMAAEARAAGCQALALEASSHALWERRMAGFRLAAAAFTNLTQDHLDYHGTMDAYAAAKELLFSEFQPPAAAFNADDPVGATWAQRYRRPGWITFGFGQDADVRCLECETKVDWLRLRVSYLGQESGIEMAIGGRFNASNALAAAATLAAMGFPLAGIAEALGHATPAPGRFEPVPNDLGIGVLIDYAHTDDALDKLLRSARELEPRRLIVVFGSGGDRDRSKRPRMGRVAAQHADLVVVTSDNPRTEDPAKIIEDVAAGFPPDAERALIVDRREAVAYAIGKAMPGDLVVIAGKGHETYQVIGDDRFPMDDRELGRQALEARSR